MYGKKRKKISTFLPDNNSCLLFNIFSLAFLIGLSFMWILGMGKKNQMIDVPTMISGKILFIPLQCVSFNLIVSFLFFSLIDLSQRIWVLSQFRLLINPQDQRSKFYGMINLYTFFDFYVDDGGGCCWLCCCCYRKRVSEWVEKREKVKDIFLLATVLFHLFCFLS